MELLDARRLTGPNRIMSRAGSVIDVRCTQNEARELIPLWQSQVKQLLAKLDWAHETKFAHTLLSSGVSLAFTGPVDALYTATEINELAFARCTSQQGNSHSADNELHSVTDVDKQLQIVTQLLADEANPELVHLSKVACLNNVTLLWDDDELSLGLGKHSRVWPVDALPDSDTLDWQDFDDIPIGVVTGTNGKTTTVRLISHILNNAGLTTGFSSTDGVFINDRIVESGDWSGPGGARLLLRQRELDRAILETARGGLLRRGLGVERATAALITNVSEDHLGDFGSENLTELLSIKWTLSQVVECGGVLILNADDPLLVAKSAEHSGKIVWFSLMADNEAVQQHTSDGGTAYVMSHGNLVRSKGTKIEALCAADTVPITLSGRAKHNIANALGAIAMASLLGAADADIVNGLKSMTMDLNPGRLNLYDVGGVTVVVDYAHNPAGIQAIGQLVSTIHTGRKLLAFSQPGDRPDALIRDLTRAAWQIKPDKVIVSELADYHRGREHGEVYAVIKNELIACGAAIDQIDHFNDELQSLEYALGCAQPGDLVIMLALGASGEIRNRLQACSTAS